MPATDDYRITLYSTAAQSLEMRPIAVTAPIREPMEFNDNEPMEFNNGEPMEFNA